MKQTLLFLATLAFGAAPIGAQSPAPIPSLHVADSLLRERRYLELADALERAGEAPRHRIDFYRGILDNRRNRNANAIALLRPLLTDPDLAADTASRRVLLSTLADSYAKLYQYRDASHVVELTEREFSARASPEGRAQLSRNSEFWRLLVDAPPQEVESRSAMIAMRRGALGVHELPVWIAGDSSSWLFDTGANFSTIVESAAARWGLSLSAETSSVASITGLRVKLRTAVVPLARIGDLAVRNMVVLVVPDSALYVAPLKHQITAILGFPVIEAMKVLTLRPDRLDVMQAPADGAETELLVEYLTPLVRATVDGQPGLYHLDTGANRSTFSRRFVDAYPARFTGLSPQEAASTGAGGTRRVRTYTLSALPFGFGSHRVMLSNVEVSAERTPAGFENFLGNVGQDVIGDAVLTLDFARMRAILSR